MLRNSFKIPYNTKTEFFELIFYQSDPKIWQKDCREDLSSVLETLACCLAISVVTHGFLCI